MPTTTVITTRVTRSKAAKSKPSVFESLPTAPTTKKAASTKSKKTLGARKNTSDSTTANTSKSRAKQAASGRVRKPAAVSKRTPASKKGSSPKKNPEPKATPAHEPTLTDMVEGVALKIQGAIMGDPEKTAAGTAKLNGTDGKTAEPKVKTV